MRYFIIGAGFWGSVMAERVATVLREPVTVVERRSHIGGNCHSSFDEETGIECHRYGSHIFHTTDRRVWDYITKFTEFNAYQHKVLTKHQGRVFQMPINLSTINDFYGRTLSPTEARTFLDGEIARSRIENPANLEEKAVSLIGRPLYEAFIRGYTAKQWEHDPKDLPASIITRLPFRTSYDTRYFDAPWQGLPLEGYHKVFENLLANPLIEVKLNTSLESVRDSIPADSPVIYTGMPDHLFGCRYGRLEWRSLDFEWETLPEADHQGTAVMNYADQDVPYTRVHEFKHYHPERREPFALGKTVICREYSKTYRDEKDEAYYPVNDEANNALYRRYVEEAGKDPRLVLGGRLGAYRYWDMDRAIANALETFENVILPKFGPKSV